MDNYTIGCDAHKHYSVFAVLDRKGTVKVHKRIEHEPGAIQAFLEAYPSGTRVALESVGNWYWIADEIEAAGCIPLLTHPAKAKVMMGNVNKTDKLDAKGLATLVRLNSLPYVWLPPGKTRDDRELPRTRMALTKIRTALKNRIHATLAKYNRKLEGASDIFIPKWREELMSTIDQLPPETQRCMRSELDLLDHLMDQIQLLETHIQEVVEDSEAIQLLNTLPGIGSILGIVIRQEIGRIDRFPSAEHFASYCGVVPTVKSSGGKFHYGRMRKQSNQYLKWAFIEAANVVVLRHTSPKWRSRHVARLYRRIRNRKGSKIAVGAVARHLAEAAYWVLTKQEPYREPAASRRVTPKSG
ncbi:MAG: IS110 family transposase [Anaerolineales bacterium]|jgi:transposase